LPQETPLVCSWQAPEPLQAPVLPHGSVAEVAHRVCGSAVPDGTLAHVPGVPATLQAMQVAHDVDPQQTPSTQVRPDRQSAVAVQACPWRFLLPHRFVIGSQMVGLTQSASPLQAVLQLVVPLHTYGVQLVVVAALQVPAPSQVRAFVCVDPELQLEETQIAPAAYRWQAPAPSQTPVVPQVATPWSLQVPCGSLAPAVTLLQVPALADRLHDLQVPLQLVEQQTPWLQKPDLHSVALAQLRPLSLRPQELLMQTAGRLQSLLLVQAILQAFVPQTYGEQDAAAGLTQVPAPSQVDAPVKVTEPLGQVAVAQVVPLAYF
jgi:hypothetical protein